MKVSKCQTTISVDRMQDYVKLHLLNSTTLFMKLSPIGPCHQSVAGLYQAPTQKHARPLVSHSATGLYKFSGRDPGHLLLTLITLSGFFGPLVLFCAHGSLGQELVSGTVEETAAAVGISLSSHTQGITYQLDYELE